ncbi:hypothetical protein [Capnocytophaga canimorsus]|uniref:hypothetical protein n=1 Tax=Capnocytophaga canimorsus TaxID=28188 RepID=UPI001EDE9BE5|nr:hypothetical protein [Capnocytophaga canimorsus]GJQ03773.1 hypothetical protein CAPN009_01880 [Capnocytophaga canimorsus]
MKPKLNFFCFLFLLFAAFQNQQTEKHYCFYVIDEWNRDYSVIHYIMNDTILTGEEYRFYEEKYFNLNGSFKDGHIDYKDDDKGSRYYKYFGELSDEFQLFKREESGDSRYYKYDYMLKKISLKEYDSIVFNSIHPPALPNFYMDTIFGKYKMEFMAQKRNVKNHYGQVTVCIYDKETDEFVQSFVSDSIFYSDSSRLVHSFEYTDFNFDGVKDIAFHSLNRAAYGTYKSEYYFFSQKNNKFVYDNLVELHKV